MKSKVMVFSTIPTYAVYLVDILANSNCGAFSSSLSIPALSSSVALDDYDKLANLQIKKEGVKYTHYSLISMEANSNPDIDLSENILFSESSVYLTPFPN